MNIRKFGDETMIRTARPAEYAVETDASGATSAPVQVAPEIREIYVPGQYEAGSSPGMLGIAALAVAAYLAFK